MKWNCGNRTHPNYAIPPEQFRAQATGVGVTRSRSEMTGGLRAQRVADSIPADCRAKVPEAEGYPPATPSMDDMDSRY